MKKTLLAVWWGRVWRWVARGPQTDLRGNTLNQNRKLKQDSAQKGSSSLHGRERPKQKDAAVTPTGILHGSAQ